MRPILVALLVALLVLPAPFVARADSTLALGKTVVMRAAAVAQTPSGFVGSTATISITAGANGTGHVFLDTFPLTEVDMQGSARLAARVAAQVTGKDLSTYDFFFVIRSDSVQIGGPSAGADMTVGAVAALQGWDVRADALETGTIQPDGSVGPVGGIPEKAAAAQRAGMHLFLYPEGQDIQPLSTQPGVQVNMPDYCRSLGSGFECKPIGDVIDAVNLMTDHAIDRPPIRGNVTDERYRATLLPLSQQLVDGAAGLADEARAAIGALPAGATRADLERQLASVNETMGRARAAETNGTYYTAASLSFQASAEPCPGCLGARGLREIARILAQPAASQQGAVQSLVDAAAQHLADVRAQVDAAKVTNTSQLEPIGAAQSRVLEAERWIASAQTQAANMTRSRAAATSAVHDASYAIERADTARWWLELGTRAASVGSPVDPKGLQALAQDSITSANEVVAYVDAVFTQAQVTAGVAGAQATLAEATAAIDRGYTAAALFDAFQAQTQASVTLEEASFANGIPASKLETARVGAARAIQAARERGSEPFLAQSQYEFGLSESVPVSYRLEYLREARLSANVAGVSSIFTKPQPVQSRFQGVPDTLGVAPGWVAASFALGIAAGAGLGLAALMPRTPKREEPPGGPRMPDW